MIRQASLLALVLALGACADNPASVPAASEPAVSEQAEAANAARPGAPDDEAREGDEAGDAARDAAVVPPAAAVAAFQSGHAGATGLAWSRESDGGYEASFAERGQRMSVIYAADGTPGEVETEIAVSDLPPAITAALARDHAGKTVTEAARIVSGGQTTYEAEITEGDRTRDLVFTADGAPVAAPAD